MLGVLVIVGVAIVLAAGFWFTRKARGPGMLEVQRRAYDFDSHISQMGTPLPGADAAGARESSPGYNEPAAEPSEEAWARERELYRQRRDRNERE